MLYTILPFLFWFNAQRNAPLVIRALPRVSRYLPDEKARPQFYAHCAALVFLLCAFFWPQVFFYPALLLLILSVLWLYKNIVLAIQTYRSALILIQTTVAERNRAETLAQSRSEEHTSELQSRGH